MKIHSLGHETDRCVSRFHQWVRWFCWGRGCWTGRTPLWMTWVGRYFSNTTLACPTSSKSATLEERKIYSSPSSFHPFFWIAHFKVLPISSDPPVTMTRIGCFSLWCHCCHLCARSYIKWTKQFIPLGDIKVCYYYLCIPLMPPVMEPRKSTSFTSLEPPLKAKVIHPH